MIPCQFKTCVVVLCWKEYYTYIFPNWQGAFLAGSGAFSAPSRECRDRPNQALKMRVLSSITPPFHLIWYLIWQSDKRKPTGWHHRLWPELSSLVKQHMMVVKVIHGDFHGLPAHLQPALRSVAMVPHNFIMGLLPWIGKPSFNIIDFKLRRSHSTLWDMVHWMNQAGQTHKPPCLWMIQHDSTK